MSRKATDWAWSQRTRNASEKIVLLSLADRADEFHQCYPSIERLERDTTLNRKTIIKVMDRLEADGYLFDTGDRKGRTQRVKVYQLCVLDEAQKENDSKSGTVPVFPGNSPKSGTSNSPNFGTQNQSLEPVKESKRGARARPLDTSVLPNDLSECVWTDWLQHRRDKRSPVKTQTVVNTVARELERARVDGWTPDEAMAEAMAAGWQGLKAEWLKNRNRPTGGRHEERRPVRESAADRVRRANGLPTSREHQDDADVLEGESYGLGQ